MPVKRKCNASVMKLKKEVILLSVIAGTQALNLKNSG